MYIFNSTIKTAYAYKSRFLKSLYKCFEYFQWFSTCINKYLLQLKAFEVCKKCCWVTAKKKKKRMLHRRLNNENPFNVNHAKNVNSNQQGNISIKFRVCYIIQGWKESIFILCGYNQSNCKILEISLIHKKRLLHGF